MRVTHSGTESPPRRSAIYPRCRRHRRPFIGGGILPPPPDRPTRRGETFARSLRLAEVITALIDRHED
jgi:hypothetical protein